MQFGVFNPASRNPVFLVDTKDASLGERRPMAILAVGVAWLTPRVMMATDSIVLETCRTR